MSILAFKLNESSMAGGVVWYYTSIVNLRERLVSSVMGKRQCELSKSPRTGKLVGV